MIHDRINQHLFDTVGLSLYDVHWINIVANQQLTERTVGWFVTVHSFLAYMSDWIRATAHQIGGVLASSINDGEHGEHRKTWNNITSNFNVSVRKKTIR